MNVEFVPVGEYAVTVRWGNRIDEQINDLVLLAMNRLEEHPFAGFVECVPAYASLTVYYNPIKVQSNHRQQTKYSAVCGLIRDRLKGLNTDFASQARRTVEIPVCYEGEFAPDLSFVAEKNGLTPSEVINIHASQTYRVYMIGFAPGFPYLGGMDEKIAAPRHATPRLSVAAGSVGIAGKQTGIYPLAMPGGWQIIGRTPVRLFDLQQNPPNRLAAGDLVRFIPIDRGQFDRMIDDAEQHTAKGGRA